MIKMKPYFRFYLPLGAHLDIYGIINLLFISDFIIVPPELLYIGTKLLYCEVERCYWYYSKSFLERRNPRDKVNRMPLPLRSPYIKFNQETYDLGINLLLIISLMWLKLQVDSAKDLSILRRDDEFSIALAAFNEAINQYSSVMGRSFLGFAETVIGED